MTREEWQQQRARQVKEDMRRLDLLMTIHNDPAFTVEVLKKFVTINRRKKAH